MVVGDVHMVNPSARRVRTVASDASGLPSSKRRPWFRRSAQDWGDGVTLHVGDPFPDIELVDHEGRPWRTAEMRGRPLVLVLHRHLA